jgi:pyruvate/2-oxoglutarate dehydrogenase complex dihydrolipoamide acyltransferase (E2) component
MKHEDDQAPLRILPFPRARRIMIDVMEQASLRHHVWGFGEVDITLPKQRIAQHKAATGEQLSFTAYVVRCLALAIAEHPEVQAIKVGNRLHVFEDVDVATLIERESASGLKVPTSYIVRRAQRKSHREIHAELRAAQQAELQGTSLGDSKAARQANWFERLPKLLRRIVWWRVNRDPRLRRRLIGTTQVTAVGMFVDAGGWAISRTIWSLAVIVGGQCRKPGVVDGEVVIRDYLSLTISVDHDVVDGGPAARFAQRFAALLSSGDGIGTGAATGAEA